jgi:hypothetical protein
MWNRVLQTTAVLSCLCSSMVARQLPSLLNAQDIVGVLQVPSPCLRWRASQAATAHRRW